MSIERTPVNDDWYWELLEEQHAHDVVISGAVESEEEENEGSDKQRRGS